MGLTLRFEPGREVSPWLISLFLILLAYLVGVWVRVLPLYLLPDPEHAQFLGRWMMATNDAYGWLAGAAELNHLHDRALPRFIGWLHATTGMPLDYIGFFAPAYLAPLVAVAVFVLARFWGLGQAGALLAAWVTVLVPGFLARSRVGYLDDELWTLLLPLILVGGLAVAIEWARRREPIHLVGHLLLGIGCGLFALFYLFLYSKAVPIVLALFGVAGLVGLLAASPSNRSAFLLGWGAALAVWLGGLPGLVAALLLVAAAYRWPVVCRQWWLVGGLVLVGLALLTLHGGLPGAVQSVLRHLSVYFGEGRAVRTGGEAALWPSAMVGIAEAQRLGLADLAGRIAGHWLLFVPALAGYVWLAWRRPSAWVLLPLLGLGLAAYWLGERFTMYAAPVAGLGLASALGWLLAQRDFRPIVRHAVLAGLLLAPLLVATTHVAQRPFQPSLSEEARTVLNFLRFFAPADGQLWISWEDGYAAQYHAARRVFADGSTGMRGSNLYLLSLVMATHSPQQSAQVMRWAALQQHLLVEAEPQVDLTDLRRQPRPAEWALEAMSLEEANRLLRSLGAEAQAWPEGLPQQYLVVQWEDLLRSYWIIRNGFWNRADGVGPTPTLALGLPGSGIGERGEVMTNVGPLRVGQVDMVGERGALERTVIEDGGELYAIYNHLNGQLLVMGSLVYRSMLVQLLLGEREAFEEQFELMVDRAPWARGWRVR